MIVIITNYTLLLVFIITILKNPDKGIYFMSFLIPIEGYIGQLNYLGVLSLIKLVGLILFIQAVSIFLKSNKSRIETIVSINILLLLWATLSLLWTSNIGKGIFMLFSILQYVLLFFVYMVLSKNTSYITHIKAFMLGAIYSIILSIFIRI